MDGAGETLFLEEFPISLGAGEDDLHPQLAHLAARCHHVVRAKRRLDAERQIRRGTLDRTQPVEHEHVFYLLKYIIIPWRFGCTHFLADTEHLKPLKSVWLGDRVVRVLDLRSIGCQFKSRSATLGKLFTHTCLCHQAVFIWYRRTLGK